LRGPARGNREGDARGGECRQAVANVSGLWHVRSSTIARVTPR
jgi:hypothetical protein